jgi:heme/copper-type cytochrome/quinol oxidase subunit 2
VIVVASLQEYLPLGDIVRIVAVCMGVAVIAPVAASLVITGFAAQSSADSASRSRVGGDARIALGVAILVVLIVAGIYALAFR